MIHSHWKSRRALAFGVTIALVTLVAACGGKVENIGDETTDPLGGGGSGAGGGGGNYCTTCLGDPACSYCLIMGYDQTYRCPIGATRPKDGCMNLGEQYTDESGYGFTCYYCD